jgi:hypoxanthine phosphoribosyltransferase
MDTVQLNDKFFEIFLTQSEIEKRIKELAKQINIDYKNQLPLFVGILNGSFMFLSDLKKEITLDSRIEFIKVSSYKGGTKSTGEVQDVLGLDVDIKGRDVIIVEDIVDTGKTLTYLLSTLKTQQPASIKVVTLLLKPDALETQIPELDYIGFKIGNDFVVGYGMDYNHLGRNLRDVYKLRVSLTRKTTKKFN